MRRRTFFGVVGAGAASAALPLSGGLGRGRGDARGAELARTRGPSLDFLLAPLAGRPLSGGFRVESVSAIERGSVAVTLVRQDGTRAYVQVFRRSPVSSGLGTTRLLDLRWMNGGDGAVATHEGAGLAVMSLAARVRRIEAAVLREGLSQPDRAQLRALHTHEQRTARYGGFVEGPLATEQA